MVKFYLGCPEPHWLGLTSVPLFVSQRAENTRLAIEYCLAHPTWRLSTQTHKFLGIP